MTHSTPRLSDKLIRLTECKEYIVSHDVGIREAMGRLNTSRFQFQLVVGPDGQLLGTITDGDVRRAILRGVDLDQPVTECMHTETVLGKAGRADENAALLTSVPITFLPVVDEGRRVVEVLVAADKKAPAGTALIMAGGYGTRLGERTRTTPKPLLHVAEKPILGHLLDDLEANDFDEIIVSTHYLSDQIKAFVDARENSARIRILHEPEPLGTAGAIGCLPDPTGQPLLVVNGDLVTSTNYRALRDFHFRHGDEATLAVARFELEIPFGVVRHDDDGKFLGIDEKPMAKHFVAAGIYFLSPEFCALVPENKPMDMPDLLNLGRGIGLRIGLFPIHEYWIDVGRPDDLDAADTSHQRKA